MMVTSWATAPASRNCCCSMASTHSTAARASSTDMPCRSTSAQDEILHTPATIRRSSASSRASARSAAGVGVRLVGRSRVQGSAGAGWAPVQCRPSQATASPARPVQAHLPPRSAPRTRCCLRGRGAACSRTCASPRSPRPAPAARQSACGRWPGWGAPCGGRGVGGRGRRVGALRTALAGCLLAGLAPCPAHLAGPRSMRRKRRIASCAMPGPGVAPTALSRAVMHTTFSCTPSSRISAYSCKVWGGEGG